ncbi:malonate decarboxylase holo-[acyl-carrier-protein] synthase [Stenotrophomonas bentonitica]|uniref:malonate decarboxylase holo-[acyl-carrier-protein] synthase n=1 Tax=Stenotrophomonas bentonitica TaxID=1450134 RepID=UPI0037CDBC09
MRRHDLVWLDPQAPWQVLSAGAEARLRAWAQARLPFVVARRDPTSDEHQLRLGVPLPLAEHRQRLSLRVDPSAVLRSAPPPLLTEVATDIGAGWRDRLHALATETATLPVAPRVFGSAAWQHLTGLGYLHDGSDIDLLWDVTGTGQAETIVAVLQHCERRSPMRLDGELRFPVDRAVNWREYASGAARLMVKGNHACSLVPREALTAWQVAA